MMVVLCLAVETRQHPLPVPGFGRKDASLPSMANEIVVATLSMVPRWRLDQYFPLLLCAGCHWVPLEFAGNVPYRLFQCARKKNYEMSTWGGIPPDEVDCHTACVPCTENISRYLVWV